MNDDKHSLTGEERAYLQRLFAETPPTAVGPGFQRLVLDPANGDPELLGQLLMAGSMELRAGYPGYTLRFELELERPPAGSPVALRFGVPAVIEDRLQPRCARVVPQPREVEVIVAKGVFRRCKLLDISASGVRLQTTGWVQVPSGRLELDIALGNEPHRVGAQVVRVESTGRLRARSEIALRFLEPDRATREAINRFVLDRLPGLGGVGRTSERLDG